MTDCLHEGVSGDISHPARPGAGIIGGNVGASCHDLYLLNGYPHLLRYQLLQYGVSACSLVEGRAYDSECAIGFGSQDNSRITGTGVPSKEGNAPSPVRCGLGLLPLGCIQGSLEDLTESYTPEPLACSVFFAFTDDVLEPKLSGVHAQLLGDDIRVRLQCEVGRQTPRPTKITARDRVRVNLKKLKKGMIDSVGPSDIIPCG